MTAPTTSAKTIGGRALYLAIMCAVLTAGLVVIPSKPADASVISCTSDLTQGAVENYFVVGTTAVSNVILASTEVEMSTGFDMETPYVDDTWDWGTEGDGNYTIYYSTYDKRASPGLGFFEVAVCPWTNG